MNLNIEGTKHEKAVLVILSYVAGFTAGFIIFGLSQNISLQSESAYPEVVSADTLTETTPTSEVEMAGEELTETVDDSQQVLYKDGRLMANANGASVLLSAQLNTVDAETAKVFANQGVHEVIPNYQASPDGNYIYYCEQHTTTDACTNFVYSVTDQIIQYVTLDGVKLTSSAASAQTATWNGELLSIDNAQSLSADAPWKLTTAQ